MRGAVRLLYVVACLACAVTVAAQEGHPLVGSWHGDWGMNAKERTDLTLIVDYTPDGADVTGIVNPGFDQATVQTFQLTVPKVDDWHVKFEVELKDKAGKVTRYVADGKIDKLGSDRRTMTGSWTAGAAKGDFKLTRDRDYSR
jgi:hypothetical protein